MIVAVVTTILQLRKEAFSFACRGESRLSLNREGRAFLYVLR